MSQVIRKFAEGGASEPLKEPSLFEWENVGKYNRDDLVTSGFKGLDTYISQKGLTGKKAQAFRDAATQFLNATKEGKIRRKADGSYEVTGGGMASTGEYDKGFLGIGTKNTENNAFNEVGSYMNNLIGSASTYETPKPKELQGYNYNIKDAIKGKYFGGKDFQLNDWSVFDDLDDKTGERGTTNRLGNIASLYEDEANKLLSDEAYRGGFKWGNDNEYQETAKKYQDLANELRTNGFTDADRRLGFMAGQGSLNDYLSTGVDKQEDVNPSLVSPEIRAREEQALKEKAQREAEQKALKNINTNEEEKYNLSRDTYFSDLLKKSPFKGRYSGILANESTYNAEGLTNTIKKKYNNSPAAYLKEALDPGLFRGTLVRNAIGKDGSRTNITQQHLTNNLDFAINSGQLKPISDKDNRYVIPGTEDYDNWSAIVYDPATRQYKETSMLVDKALRGWANKEYEKRNPKQFKDGGNIIKLQQGGWTDDITAYSAYTQQFANKKKQEQQRVQTKADTSGRTPEQVQAGERKVGNPLNPTSSNEHEWSTEDKIRLGSAAADVGSIIAAFVPGYGTAASAVLGVGSTAGGLTADIMDDSVSAGQTALNAGYGLGMDLIGLIPGLGATGKAGKIVKGLTKVAPKLLMAWGAYQNTIPAANALNKLMHDSGNMTVDDWKALSAGLTTLAGGTRMVGGKKALNRYAPETTSKMVRTKSGKMVPMSTDQFDQLSHASGLKAQNDVLGGIHKGEELGQEFIPRNLNPFSKNRSFGAAPQSKTVKGRSFIENTGSERIDRDEALFRRAGNIGAGVNKGEQKVADAVSDINLLPNWMKNFGTAKNPNYKKPTPTETPPRPVEKPKPMEAKVNADEVVAKQTIPAHTPIADMFIPKKPTTGAARAAKEAKYEGVFGKQLQAENDANWQQMFTERRKTRKVSEAQAKKSKAATSEERKAQTRKQHEEGLLRSQNNLNISPNFRAPVGTELTYTAPDRVASSTYPVNAVQQKIAQMQRDIQLSMTRKAASQSNALPHKQKKTQPKGKKGNKGYVNKKAEGGVIELFKDGGGPRIKAKDTSKWNRASALANYNWGADVDNYLKGKTGPDNGVDTYINSFNGGEDIYDQLTSKTGDYFGGKYNYSVQDPLAKQRQITFRGTNQGFDDSIRNSIVGYGTSEGTTGYDVYAGDRTGNRTLGRGLTAADVTKFNSQLNPRGMELYDKGNGTYRLRRYQNIAPTVNTVVEKPAPVVAPTVPQELSSVTAGNRVVKPKGKFGIVPEDALALGRMVSGLVTNNRAAAKYKEGLRPNLISTFENQVPVQGNFQAKNAAYGQAAELESLAARPFTSDASLQLAGQLEAGNRAGQMRTQGDMADADMFYRTRMLGQQESDAGKARRVEAANHNMAAMGQIDAAKAQIDSARMTANYAQVLAPWLGGVENQFRQKRAINQQVNLEAAAQGLSSKFDTDYRIASNSIQERLNKWKETNPNGTEDQYFAGPGKKDFETLRGLQNQYRLDSLGLKKHLASPWLFSRGIVSEEKGGKLTKRDKEKIQRAKDFNKRLLADNKQFHKDIMESKKEHNKLLISMSGLTSELIKRAMT